VELQAFDRSKESCAAVNFRPIRALAFAAIFSMSAVPACAQNPNGPAQMPPDTQSPTPNPALPQTQPPRAQNTNAAPADAPGQPVPLQAMPANQPPSLTSPPVAIVPLDSSIPGAALSVGGAMQAWKGRAYITSNGAITAGPAAAQVTLPYRGTLRVCPSTTVRLSVDASASTNEIPGLQIALDGGAVEASFAVTRDSDVVLTPNFRIMIGAPGASEVKIRLGQEGDTCVDNSGANAPYVVVTSVFDSGLYRVQPGQRVMFEHGDLHTVVDQEKEPCGCPSAGQKPNEFPLAQSEGLMPLPVLSPPATSSKQPGGGGEGTTTLVYNAPGNQTPQPAAIPQPPPPPQTTTGPVTPRTTPQPKQRKLGVFRRIGRFFKRIFGAE
jgi:hypothetical protein